MPLLHIFSFFSGSGFLDLGFEKCGYVVDSVNEYSDSFANAYRYAREKMGIAEPRFGYTKDVTEFLSKEGSKQLRENGTPSLRLPSLKKVSSLRVKNSA